MRNGRISANTRLNRQGNWASWHVFISKQPQCYTDGGKEWTVQALTSKALPRDVMSLTIHDPPNPLYSASIFFFWLQVVDCFCRLQKGTALWAHPTHVSENTGASHGDAVRYLLIEVPLLDKIMFTSRGYLEEHKTELEIPVILSQIMLI